MSRKCRNCNVIILDSVVACPLCHSVLEKEEGEERVLDFYPDVSAAERRLSLFARLYTFLSLVGIFGLFLINYLTFAGIWWSAISGAGILYFYLTLRYSVVRNRGHRWTLFIQTMGALLVTMCIDWFTGRHGWSLSYILPSTILFLDVAILLLMIVNREYWQNYLLFQVLTLLLSLTSLLLWRVHIISSVVLPLIAFSVSAVLFAGTLFFGERKAWSELKRRFHL